MAISQCSLNYLTCSGYVSRQRALIACRFQSVGTVSRFVPVLNGGEARLLPEYAAEI